MARHPVEALMVAHDASGRCFQELLLLTLQVCWVGIDQWSVDKCPGKRSVHISIAVDGVCSDSAEVSQDLKSDFLRSCVGIFLLGG